MNTKELKQYINRVLGNKIRCLLPSFWWKRLFGEVVDSIEEVSTSVNKLSEELSDLNNYVNITRDELFKLVQDEKLVPGRYYRISDYECTVRAGINAIATQNSNFAIVVKALSKSELDENANAAFKPNYGGTLIYNKWQLKYSIYNDVFKYPWARRGTIEYDAAVTVDSSLTSRRKAVIGWDSETEKYIVDYDPYRYEIYKGMYLITSETDKTPLAQTSFNYGDTVYIYDYGNIYPAEISYTKAMRDSGDAVLVRDTNSIVASYIFKWNSEKEAYTEVLNDSRILIDTTGTTIPKRDAFTSPENVKIKNYNYNLEFQTSGFNTPDGKGVIYYLKDGNNNEAYYDFKNIAFLFPEVSSEPVFTFDWDGREESESYAKNVKIENAGDLNYVSFNVDPNENRGGLDSVVVSSKVKNQYFNNVYKNIYIGYDDNNNLSVVNIFNNTEHTVNSIDTVLSDTSENAVQNKVITAALNNKADKTYVDNAVANVTVDTSNLATKEELNNAIATSITNILNTEV